MADYGDIGQVKKMLRPNEITSYGTDINDRLTAIQKTVTQLLNNAIYGTSGVSVADTSQLLFVGDSPWLKLRIPARSITSVTVGGMVEGDTLVGGTPYESDRYTYRPVDRFGRILGLQLNGGNWGYVGMLGSPLTPVKVVGDFVDSDDDAAVPDDLTYAANLLIYRFFQRERASLAQTSGPDGLFDVVANPMEDPIVRNVIKRHRVPQAPRF